MREYAKNRRANDPVFAQKCRDASKKSQQNRRNKNIDTTQEWKKDNKDRVTAYNKEYAQKNALKIAANKKVNDEKTKEKRKKLKKEWVKNNKENICEYNKVYFLDRYRNDPIYKLKMTQRNRIRVGLKAKTKVSSTCELLGCSFIELKAYIEKQFVDGMNWANMGKWHIDHIIPLAAFDLSIKENQKIVFHYTNLQPLWAEENLKKGAKYA